MAGIWSRFGVRSAAAHVVAISTSCATLTLTPAAFAWGECDIGTPLQFAYPSVDTEATIPRNAQLLFVVDGMINNARLNWPDYEHTASRDGSPFDRYRFDVSERLTPGRHQAVLVLDESSNAKALEPDAYPLRFDVEDVLAPLPDETSRVAITNVSLLRRWVGGVLREDGEAIATVVTDPTDCSADVAAQILGGCGLVGGGPSGAYGDHLVQLEAEGPALGYVINESYFMPASCRSTFLPREVAPFRVQVVTETGLGSASEYGGEVELVVSSDPDPVAAPRQQTALGCRLGAPGSSGAGRGMLELMAVLVGLGVARRAARQRRRRPTEKSRDDRGVSARGPALSTFARRTGSRTSCSTPS
jgi:hypothetical protein